MGNVAIWMQAYNAEKTIVRAIESIHNQSYTNWELHILNNGSTDNTGAVIRTYAKQDNRIVTYTAAVNNIDTLRYYNDVIENTSANWLAMLDADDEYRADFLEKMVIFAESEKLDVAACGYEKICAQTGRVLRRKALEYNMIISGDDFAEKFIEYRGFTPYLWAKLTSVAFLKQNFVIHPGPPWSTCIDSIMSLQVFQKATRAGIYGEPMYVYYQYPSSLSRKVDEESIASFNDYWRITKEYIESYGPISKLNEDFLYAIYLSIMDENLSFIYSSSLEFRRKIDLIKCLFTNPIAIETFNRNADPVFRNLAGRKQFAQNVINWIKSQPENTFGDTGEVLDILQSLSHVVPS